MSKITQFTFFDNYYDVIKELPDEDKKNFLVAIVEYIFEDKKPNFTGLNKGIWQLIERPLSISKNKSNNARKDKSNENQQEINLKSNENQKEIKRKSNKNQRHYSLSISNSNSNSISKDSNKDNRVIGEEEKEEGKIKYGEFVSMTNAEYEKLVSTYGEEFTKTCIETLDNYKGAKGKKYKSDYRAILSWVVDKVKKDSSSSMSWQEREEQRINEEREKFLRGEE